MSIFVDKNTRVLVQGITGNEGQFHTRQCVSYGTNVVAGVTPGKGGLHMDAIPVFNGVRDTHGSLFVDWRSLIAGGDRCCISSGKYHC